MKHHEWIVLLYDVWLYLFIMGKLIISETERKNILSLYELTNNTPPPSESVLVVNKNPFRYPEYVSARRIYSSDLKDGDLFYVLIKNNVSYNGNLINSFDSEFVKNLIGKKARRDDKIIEFINPIVYESKNFGGAGIEMGEIKIKIGDNIELYTVHKQTSRLNNKLSFIINFNPVNYDPSKNGRFNIPSINNLYTDKYINEIEPKFNINNLPDEYFEIRKIQRLQTDF